MFKGFLKPQWWPSGVPWGGTFIDLMQVETMNKVIKMLLDKQLAVLVSKWLADGLRRCTV